MFLSSDTVISKAEGENGDTSMLRVEVEYSVENEDIEVGFAPDSGLRITGNGPESTSKSGGYCHAVRASGTMRNRETGSLTGIN